MMETLKGTVVLFVQVINWLVLIRIVLSWVARDMNNGFTNFVYQVTEPMLGPIRDLLQRLGLGGTLDFSPIVLVLLLNMLVRLVISF